MNPGPLGHESSALTTRPRLLALYFLFSFIISFKNRNKMCAQVSAIFLKAVSYHSISMRNLTENIILVSSILLREKILMLIQMFVL